MAFHGGGNNHNHDAEMDIFEGLADIVKLPELDFTDHDIYGRLPDTTTPQPAQSLTAQVRGQCVGTSLIASPRFSVKVISKEKMDQTAVECGATLLASI